MKYDKDFVEIAYEYTRFYNRILKELKDKNLTTNEPERKFFKAHTQLDLTSYAEYITVKESIKNKIIDTDLDRWNFGKFLINFAYFVKYAEKSYMYCNDDSYPVFVSINDDEDRIIINFDCNEYTIKYDIQRSEINLPGTRNRDNALSRILDPENYNDYEPDKAIFCNIKVNRLYGEKMESEFSFLLGSPIPLADKSDDILFNNITDIVKNMVFETIFDILNKITMVIPNDEFIDVKEVINNDKLDIWRLRSR